MKRDNSPRVKILYDIYHAQIMDGDIVRTINDDMQWIGHFHTGGNPGRHDIDETQELNYRFIVQSIVSKGFTGFLSHEYSPTAGADPIAVLNKAIEICDVLSMTSPCYPVEPCLVLLIQAGPTERQARQHSCRQCCS
jgi:hydroxypyruvate isomerase